MGVGGGVARSEECGETNWKPTEHRERKRERQRKERDIRDEILALL